MELLIVTLIGLLGPALVIWWALSPESSTYSRYRRLYDHSEKSRGL